jgi:cytochrome c oxidase subunit I
MSATTFDLPIRSDASRRTTSAWLLLGLFCLVGAGVFSILLVLARTRFVQELIPLIDFFHIALVVHVNLPVLIWLLAVAHNWLAGLLLLALLKLLALQVSSRSPNEAPRTA